MPRLTSLSRSVAGRVAIVTGAASGMGRATAYLLADEGARVAVTDLKDPTDVVKAITDAGGDASGWVLDVSDPSSITEVVTEIAGHFGGIDILVNNAGMSAISPLLDDSWESIWERTISVNLTGEARMVRACMPHLQQSDAGRVVNIASTEGVGASGAISPYTTSKHGVIGLTRSLAVEFGHTGVTFNCVCPGPIHTGMTEIIPQEAKEKYSRRRVPLRRYGDPEEVAHMTVSLCLPAASYVNGAVVVVDGGLTVKNS